MTSDNGTFHLGSHLEAIENVERFFSGLSVSEFPDGWFEKRSPFGASSVVPSRWTLQGNFFKFYGKVLSSVPGNLFTCFLYQNVALDGLRKHPL